ELGVSALKIEGRLKGPEYVAATTRLYRAAVDAAIGRAVPPSKAMRTAALQTFSRGSGPGFLFGVDHQRTVEGRGCDHRGTHVGELVGSRISRGRHHWVTRTTGALARGDGILVEGGFAGDGELGGRIWALVADGDEVDAVPAGREVLVWLGPDKA